MSENTEGVVPDFAAEIDQNIGRNLKAMRESRGIAQADLARRVAGLGVPGFHQTTIARIESGQRALRASEAIAICRILETSIESLAESGGSARMRSWGQALSERLNSFDESLKQLISTRLFVADAMDRFLPYGPDGEGDEEALLQSGVDPLLYHMVESRLVHVSPVERVLLAYMDSLREPGPPRGRENAAKGRREFILDEMREWVESDE